MELRYILQPGLKSHTPPPKSGALRTGSEGRTDSEYGEESELGVVADARNPSL